MLQAVLASVCTVSTLAVIGSVGGWLFSYAPFLFSFLFWMHSEKEATLAVIYFLRYYCWACSTWTKYLWIREGDWDFGREVSQPGLLTKNSQVAPLLNESFRTKWGVALMCMSLKTTRSRGIGAYLPGRVLFCLCKRLTPLDEAGPMCMSLIFYSLVIEAYIL